MWQQFDLVSSGKRNGLGDLDCRFSFLDANCVNCLNCAVSHSFNCLCCCFTGLFRVELVRRKSVRVVVSHWADVGKNKENERNHR